MYFGAYWRGGEKERERYMCEDARERAKGERAKKKGCASSSCIARGCRGTAALLLLL